MRLYATQAFGINGSRPVSLNSTPNIDKLANEKPVLDTSDDPNGPFAVTRQGPGEVGQKGDHDIEENRLHYPVHVPCGNGPRRRQTQHHLSDG